MKRRKLTGARHLLVTAQSAEETWADVVMQLLGPRFLSDPPGKRRREALLIAAEALRAAGESDLAEEINGLI